jgi:uncharacterized protein YfkK (UPF0435 family)
MKKHIKKHISLLLAALLIISTAAMSLIAFADDNVEINAENFPDQNFRDAISLMYDVDSNGVLSKQERNIESMIVSGIVEMLAIENDVDENDLPINNLKGIEYFNSLKTLRCSSIGHIESLDISALTKLETLAANDLELQSIVLPGGSNLKDISLCSNEFTILDFSANSSLVRIHCYNNDNLESLNVSGLANLEDLRCDCCSISTLDLSTNTKLNYINCSYNKLIKLDLSNNKSLTDISEYNIGNQESSAFVKVMNGLLVVPLDLEESNVLKTSLDYGDTVAFSNGYFYTEGADILNDGIDYSYNTGISDSAFLTVHLDVIENQHYYSLCSFDFGKNKAVILCPICKDNYSLSFLDAINSRYGSKKYDSHLDVVNDGIINAKDYAKIVQEFNS